MEDGCCDCVVIDDHAKMLNSSHYVATSHLTRNLDGRHVQDEFEMEFLRTRCEPTSTGDISQVRVA